VEMRIEVVITDGASDGKTGKQEYRVNVQADLPESGERLVDEVERGILQLEKETLRSGFATYMAAVSEKRAHAVCNSVGGVVVAHPTLYRVDGEVGRITFRTYDVKNDKGTVWSGSKEFFPAQGPREYYRTAGMSELLLNMASEMSYGSATALLNRVRHVNHDLTPVRTAAAIVEREGVAVQAQIEQWATGTLKAHDFSEDGRPRKVDECDDGHGMSIPESRIQEVLSAYNATRSEEYHIPAEAPAQRYEDPERAVNVSLDDVGVKRQRETRKHGVSRQAGGTEHDPKGTSGASHRYVHNTIAHIQSSLGTYVLNGHGTVSVLRLVVAFLLHWDLLFGRPVQFFVDGQRTLQAAILERLNWLPGKRIILDWYHLRKRCEQDLSTALRGRLVRNAVLGHLLPLLWLGRVDASIEHLRNLAADSFKAGQTPAVLIGYLERNREHIPCYALRKQLGLRNSSNCGEKANDLCVAARQKHQGMSWSTSGSVALASIVALRRNGELASWCTERRLEFQGVA